MFVGKEFVAAMGKKGKWLGAVKKVFSPESKEKKEEVINLFMAALAWCSPLLLIYGSSCAGFPQILLALVSLLWV